MADLIAWRFPTESKIRSMTFTGIVVLGDYRLFIRLSCSIIHIGHVVVVVVVVVVDSVLLLFIVGINLSPMHYLLSLLVA